MPNWCCNDIEILGSKDDLDKLVENYTTDGVLDFDKIEPMPKEFLTTGEWFDWRIVHWGTKWNLDTNSGGFYRSEDDAFVGDFETAWSPPMSVIEKLSRLFPDVRIHLAYDEPNMAFQGKYIFDNGEIEEVYHREGDDYIDSFGEDFEEDDEND